MSYSHLSSKAQSLLQHSKEDRIASIRSNRWIGYSQANKILEHLEDLLSHPKTSRMPNSLLISATNNGKTAILERFKALHVDKEDNSGEYQPLSVLYIQCPPVPDERRFLAEILNKLYIPVRKNERIDNMTRQVCYFLKNMQTKIILLDEFHHSIAGSPKNQRVFLNCIKYLGNELRIPIVAAGTQEALNALSSDPQMANRFRPVALPFWKMNNEFQRLLKSFEVTFPLKHPSNLDDPAIAGLILSMSEGILGEISSLLKLAAIESIKNGQEMISIELLQKLGWVAPSEASQNAASYTKNVLNS